MENVGILAYKSIVYAIKTCYQQINAKCKHVTEIEQGIYCKNWAFGFHF